MALQLHLQLATQARVEAATNLGGKNQSIVKYRTNLKFHKQTYYAVSGKKYINSSFNTTN